MYTNGSRARKPQTVQEGRKRFEVPSFITLPVIISGVFLLWAVGGLGHLIVSHEPVSPDLLLALGVAAITNFLICTFVGGAVRLSILDQLIGVGMLLIAGVVFQVTFTTPGLWPEVAAWVDAIHKVYIFTFSGLFAKLVANANAKPAFANS